MILGVAGRCRNPQISQVGHKNNPKIQINTGKKYSLVRAVDIINCQDGQVAVVTEVTESNTSTRLKLVLIDHLLANIKGNRHGEDIAISKTTILTDTIHTPSVFNFLIKSPH